MLTPERFNILQWGYEKENTAVYMTTSNHPLSLASEIVSLVTRNDIATSKHTNQKIKNSFSWMLPPTL